MASAVIKNLNPTHLAACRMRAEARKNKDIAAELGVKERTLHLWFSQEVFKAEVSRLLQNVDEAFTERMASAGLRAIEELTEFSQQSATRIMAVCETCGWFGPNPISHGAKDSMCTGPWEMRHFISEGTKVNALREVLDRVDHTTTLRDRAAMVEARQSGGSSGEGDVTQIINVIANKTDEELLELVRTKMGLNGNGDLPVIEA